MNSRYYTTTTPDPLLVPRVASRRQNVSGIRIQWPDDLNGMEGGAGGGGGLFPPEAGGSSKTVLVVQYVVNGKEVYPILLS